MPTVRYDENVRQAALPAVRKTATPGVEAFGGGASLEKLTNAGLGLIDKGGDIFQKEMMEQKKQADQVAFMSADQKLSELETNTQIEVQKMRGENALGAPEYVTDKWKKGVDEVRKNLANDDQRAAFDRSSASRYDSLHRNTVMHVAKQAEALDDEKTKGYIETAKNAATVNASDPARVAQEVQRTQGATADWLKRKGIPVGSDAHKAEMIKATSPIYTAVINRLITDNQTPQAKQYFEQVKDVMDQDDRDKVSKFLKHSSVLAEAQVAAKDITSKYSNMTAALKDIDKIKDPEVQEKAKDLVKERFTLMEQGKKQFKDGLYESMAKKLEKTKDFIGLQNDPNWLTLDANQRSALQTRYNAVVQGVDRPTNNKKFVEFLFLSQGQLASMSQSDYEANYRQHFSNADQSKADSDITAAKKGDEKNQLLSPFSSYKDRFDDTLRSKDIVDPSNPKKSDSDAIKYSQLALAARKRVEDFEQIDLGGKRRATGEEIQKILDDMVVKKVFVSKDWARDPEKQAAILTDEEKGQSYVPYNSVPEAERSAIERLFKGKKPSRNQIERAYAAVVGKDRKRLQSIISE